MFYEKKKGAKLKEETKNSNPNLNGWLQIGKCPDFAADSLIRRQEAVTAVGMKTVAFNKLAVDMDLRKNGKSWSRNDQTDRGWGYDTTQRNLDLTEHGTVIENCGDSDLDIVSIKTVDVMASAWETDDFFGQLPPP